MISLPKFHSDNEYITIFYQGGEVKTLTAQGKISGWIIAIILPALGMVLAVMNPKHIGLLFSSKLGLGMIGTSIIMELV
ncbi:MAG: tight adherence protein [Clostridiales bacterium]|jgi:tight adherence protein B|nr:tight adherence protein [Clostridiales bacterium]MDK2933554.1 tight adherence protein [Clostridiales bacterium]